MRPHLYVLTATLVLLSLVGCGAPPSERVIDAFADGDTQKAIRLKDKIDAEGEDGRLAVFLVGLSRFLGGEPAPSGESAEIEDPDRLAAALEVHRQRSPESPYLALAAGVLAESAGEKTRAVEHFAFARDKTGDDDDTLVRAVSAAELVASGSELTTVLDAEVNGVLRPAPGLHGYLLPLEGETEVSGALRSTIGDHAFIADVAGWAYLYFGHEENAEPCGWGLAVRSGEALLTRESFEMAATADGPVVAEQGFVARLWDPLGHYVLVSFTKGEEKGLVAPVQIQWPDDADEASIEAIPTPGIGVAGHMYWAEDYEGPRAGGMMIDRRGRRVMFNTEGLRVELATPSKVEGPTGSVSLRVASVSEEAE